MFYNHHQHTDYSTLDAVAKVEDLVELAKTRGMEAVTVTDHGTLSGIFRLWNKCKKEGLKPIIGCESYWVDSYEDARNAVPYNYGHICILAMNYTGWCNLKKLQQIAWEDGFLVKPRIQISDLIKYNEGLIITTGCENGIIGTFYLKKDVWAQKKSLKTRRKRVKGLIGKLKKAFGDRLYAEVQLNDLEYQRKLNKEVLKMAKIFKLKTIVTLDSHYVKAEDSELHDVVICLKWHDSLNAEDNHTYTTKQLWYKTEEELQKARKKWHSFIGADELERMFDNTEEIVKRVETYDIMPEGSPLPVISKEPDAEMLRICKNHREYETMMKNKKYKKRFDYEYTTITRLGFANYFLVVWDIADYCRKSGIPYNARGSVNGSLVAYLMTITWIDPVRFDCPFERFLTEDRLSLPDIDMDMGATARSRVLAYTERKYGKESVAHITNFLKLKPKSAIKDAAKVLDYSFQTVNEITKVIPDSEMSVAPNSDYAEYHDRWESLEAFDRVWSFLEENEDVARIAEGLLSVNRSQGVHASGVVVTPGNIVDWCPVAYTTSKKGGTEKEKKERITEWDMYDLEDAGVLKLDFLGQNTLDIVAGAIKLISKRHDAGFTNFDELCAFLLDKLDDEETFKLIASGDSVGLFQLGTSDSMVALAKEMVVSSVEDIIVLISLHRTAILQVGMHKEYVKRRFGKHYSYEHPKMAKVLDSTKGILLFQEQTSGLAVTLAGFHPSDADNFRKGIKLKDKRKIAPWKKKFVKGCKKYSGMDKQSALAVWEFIEAFSGYGFNRCLAGDTVIDRGFKSSKEQRITIAHLYQTMNDADYAKMSGSGALRCKMQREGYGNILAVDVDGKIRPQKIKDIYYNGVKTVYEMILENGMRVKATKNHRFLCSDGYKVLKDIEIGDDVCVIGERIPDNKYLKCANTVSAEEHMAKARGSHYDGCGFKNGSDNPAYVDGEYAKVRQRGRNVEISKVVSITRCGKTETYDVEMDTEEHNFIANGIVSHNSHGCAYGFISYMTAYLKCHYPNEFMTSVISHNVDDSKKLLTYLTECKRMGLKLVNPDINRSKRNFTLVSSQLLYPLSAVKQLGDKALDSILTARKDGGKFKSLEDFQERVNGRVVNVGIILNLILIGAFRKLGKRGKLFDQLIESRGKEATYRQLYCYDCCKRYPVSIAKKKFENDGAVCPVCGSVKCTVDADVCKGKKFDSGYVQDTVFGFSFEGSKLSRFVDTIIHENANFLDCVEDIPENSLVKVAFEIRGIKKHVDKNGNTMAFLDIVDGTEESAITVFASDWAELSKHVKKGGCYIGELVKNRGKLLYNSRRSSLSQLIQRKTNNG